MLFFGSLPSRVFGRVLTSHCSAYSRTFACHFSVSPCFSLFRLQVPTTSCCSPASTPRSSTRGSRGPCSQASRPPRRSCRKWRWWVLPPFLFALLPRSARVSLLHTVADPRVARCFASSCLTLCAVGCAGESVPTVSRPCEAGMPFCRRVVLLKPLCCPRQADMVRCPCQHLEQKKAFADESKPSASLVPSLLLRACSSGSDASSYRFAFAHPVVCAFGFAAVPFEELQGPHAVCSAKGTFFLCVPISLSMF